MPWLLLSLRLTAEFVANALIPLLLFVSLLGAVGMLASYVAPQLLDILPLDRWPQPTRFLYQLIH